MAYESNYETRRRRNGAAASGPSSAIYGLGLIGSLIYFIQTASSFTDGLFGVLQSLVWPAVLVYRLEEFLRL